MDGVVVVTAVIVLLFVSLPWTFSARHRAREYERQRFGYGSLPALRRDGRGRRGYFSWGTFLALIGYAAGARAVEILAPSTAPVLSWVADTVILLTLVFLATHVTTIVAGRPAFLVRTPALVQRRAARTARRRS